MSTEPALSIVVPVYDEVENLPQLWSEIELTLGRLGLSAEVVFVDDASTDASAEVIRRFMAADPRVRMVSLDPHAGLTAAFHAGFAAARGRIVATLDSDLQNDPRDLEPLLVALDHADAAVGWRQKRNDPWTKRMSSRIANAIRNRLTREEVHDSACSLRVMRRECTAAIPPYNGMHRFVPTLLRRRRLSRGRGAGQPPAPPLRALEVRHPQSRPAGIRGPAGRALDAAARPPLSGPGSRTPGGRERTARLIGRVGSYSIIARDKEASR